MPFLRALNHLLLGIFISLVMLTVSSSAHAVTYQYLMGYVADSSGFTSTRNYGDIYADASGYTPTALQAALTKTLGQTSLTGFVCREAGVTTEMAFNAQLYTGCTCVFNFPTDPTNGTFLRKVTIAAVATGTMSGNVLSGTSTSGTTELPFDGLKAAAIFSFFFSFVMGTWVVTKNIGLILSAVKRW